MGFPSRDWGCGDAPVDDLPGDGEARAEVTILCGSVAGEPATEEAEGATVERRDGMIPERIAEARDAG